MELNTIHNCDALSGLKLLSDESVDCIVTSPPYWQMRDYGIGSIVWPDGWSAGRDSWGCSLRARSSSCTCV